MTTLFINQAGEFYTGDLQPGDRIATEVEVAAFLSDKRTYTQLRAAEYPPYADYLDAQVKLASGNPALVAEGEIQLAAYVAACLAVKEKYPKPDEMPRDESLADEEVSSLETGMNNTVDEAVENGTTADEALTTELEAENE